MTSVERHHIPTPKVPRLFPASRCVERAGGARGTAAPPALCGLGVLMEGVAMMMDKKTKTDYFSRQGQNPNPKGQYVEPDITLDKVFTWAHEARNPESSTTR